MKQHVFLFCKTITLLIFIISCNRLKVKINDDMFTINGEEIFLLGVSYFDGYDYHMEDLEKISDNGFNLVRIWLDWGQPNWYSKNYEINNPDSLRSFIQHCAKLGLVVDVTIMGGDNKRAKQEDRIKMVQNVIETLKKEPNVIYDVCNEHNVGKGPDNDQVAELIKAAQDIDPEIIIFVSNWYDGPNPWIKDSCDLQKESIRTELNSGIRVAAPHTPRIPGWEDDMICRVSQIKSFLIEEKRTIPIYLQEPARRGHKGLDPSLEEFITATKNAKDAGAAAFLFHTDASFKLNNETMFDRLDEVELEVIKNLPKQLFEKK